MTDEQLRELYGRMMDARSGDRAACPSPEVLDALVRREGAEADRLATLDHVMSCADCRRDFDLLRGVHGAAPARPVAHPMPRRHPADWRRFAPAALLAASVLVAVGLGLTRRRQAVRREIPRFRGGVYAIQLVAPPQGAIDRPPLHFVWHAAPDVRRYRLEVLDNTGAVQFTTTTSDTTATAPSDALRAGVPYQWWVRAGDGGAGAPRSGLRAFLVRR